ARDIQPAATSACSDCALSPSDRHPSDWRFPTPQELRKELAQEFTEEARSNVWSDAAHAVKTYHDELIARWKEEMDTLLVYAGLFSAILTAFSVESYQLLRPDPMDPMLASLQQISAQLASFPATPAFLNSTHLVQPLSGLKQAQFSVTPSAAWINTLWFCSLVCSLGSASIALVVKQWLHDALEGLSGTSRDSARLRQYRLNSIRKWRVGKIVASLPILLQLALALFFAGLVILLWSLHSVVAAITSALVGLLFTFFAIVTTLPVLKEDCCYRSFQAYALYTLVRLLCNTLRKICDLIWDILYKARRRSVRVRDRIDAFIRFAVREMPTWPGREQVIVARDTGLFDRTILTAAYAITLSPTHLDRLHIVLSDLPADQLSPALQDIWSACTNHWG
ncbi:hypothetical protein C8Q76DRAFT_829238, partial [Earliella scabrosa]